MKILHLFTGSLAFVDSVVKLFEKTGYENEYLCFKHTDDNRGSDLAKRKTLQVSYEEMVEMCKMSDANVFMFHSFAAVFYEIALSIPKGRIIIASIWGYDIYEPQAGCPPICQIQLYKPKTEKLLTSRRNTTVIYKILRSTKRLLLYNKRKRERIKALERQNRVLDRVDFWATILPTEFDMIKRGHSLRGKYFPFQYAAFNTEEAISIPSGDRILIGNSANPTNNHLDIFALLTARNIHNPIYLPMAYGDSEYRQEIENTLSMEKVNFDYILQRDFIPSDEYYRIIGDCKAAVFGHIRQQALGNIIMAFLHGMKVFMWKDSVTYAYLKGKGCHIYTIDEDLTAESVNEPLSICQQDFNRQVLLELFDAEKVLLRLNAALSEIEKDLLKTVC